MGWFPLERKAKLQSRWARLQFPPEFCGRFSGRIDKGAPGECGGIWIHANDIRTFTEHRTAELDFSSLEELITMAERFATQAAQEWQLMTASTTVMQ